MKITNIEKFRTELFANLEACCGATINNLPKIFFEREAENGNLNDKVTILFNCAEIDRFGKARPFYMTLDEEGQVTIWTINGGDKFFTYLTTVFDWNYTKTQYMMRVAVELCRCMNTYKD